MLLFAFVFRTRREAREEATAGTASECEEETRDRDGAVQGGDCLRQGSDSGG